MHRRNYAVYILANRHRTVLYVGITDNLERRVWEHKNKRVRGFTARYNVDQLVYHESYQQVWDAIAREKQLKGYGRRKKAALIEMENPEWKDLAADWYP